MTAFRRFALLFLVVLTVVWPRFASAHAVANLETRVWGFDLVASTLVRVDSLRSAVNHRAKSSAECTPTPVSLLAAEGFNAAKVTPDAIRAAMADAPLATKQGAVSIPVIQNYAARAAAGEVAPAIKVADGVVVEGNHRYIAGRLVGIEPAQTPGVMPAFKAGKPNVSWLDVLLDPADWGNR
jgi:hypothetical protein